MAHVLPRIEEENGNPLENDALETSESFIPLPPRSQSEPHVLERRLQQFLGSAALTPVPEIPRMAAPVLGNPMNEFTTQGLFTMAFPDLFLDGKGDPTTVSRMKEVTLAEAGKHLIKFAVQIDGEYVYPFATNNRFCGWIQDMIERHRTIKQANYCLQQNRDYANYTVDDMLRVAENSNETDELIRRIYKYTANISGSDPFWYQRRRELIAQSNQEGAGTIFFTFSAADHHWHELMPLLDLPLNAAYEERRKAVLAHPHL